MRARSTLAVLLAGTTYALAQPGADLPPPPPEAPAPAPVEEAPPLPPTPPPPAPAPPVTIAPVPPGAPVPPIVINITNNNTGNNSNTNTQTNNNTQTNAQTNAQTNTVPVTTTVTIAPPSAAPILAAPATIARAPIATYELITRRAPSNKWFAVGVIGGHDSAGVRAQLDLFGRGPFTLGIAATLGADGHDERGGRGGHHERGDDMHMRGGGVSAVAYLAWTGTIGPLDVRAQIGLGAGTSGETSGGRGHHGGQRGDNDGDGGSTTDGTTGGTTARSTTGGDTTTGGEHGDPSRGRDGHPDLAPRAEAALLVGLPLTRHLGLVGGPVLSTTLDHDKRAVDGEIMAGLRYRF